MLYLLAKAAASGVIVAAASEVARRWPGVGALIVSLPLVSLLTILWLWGETADREKVAVHAGATFWYVLPTLPMFLLLPALLRAGWGFWTALAAACVLTVVLYLLMIWIAPKAGLRLG